MTDSTEGAAQGGSGQGETPQQGGQPQGSQPASGGDSLEEQLRKARAESADWRNKYKSAQQKADEYDKLQESQKTEQQKTQERLAQLEGQATASTLKALRLEVALEKGLPKALAARLQGEDQKSIEADAEELLKTLGGRRPQTDGGQHTQGTGPSNGSNPNAFLRAKLGPR